MATLNIQHVALAYGDEPQAGNPLRRFIDWTRRIMGIQVENPLDKEYTLAPGATVTIFDGSRLTTIDGTTQFTLSKTLILANTYRFTTVAGTLPGLRAARAADLTGLAVTMQPNGDGTLTMTVAGGIDPLAAVQIGDSLFIPGTSTGDAVGPFSPANEGAWAVLVNGNSSLVLGRAGAFSGFPETVTPTSAAQVLAYSIAGIQVGDKVDVSAGFAPTLLGSYTISQVTPQWFEVTSARGLPAQANIAPGPTGMQFYTDLKTWVRIETDQEAVVRFNGDISNSVRISPVGAGDKEQVGWLDKFGATYSLTIVNRAAVPMKVLVQSAE